MGTMRYRSSDDQWPALLLQLPSTLEGEDSKEKKPCANTMVIGKSGTGKTALINFLLSQVQKIRSQTHYLFFDKDRGAGNFRQSLRRWHMALEAANLPALTLSNAKIQRQMSNSSAAL